MSATSDLRKLLTGYGIDYSKLGNNTTYVSHDGVSWEFRDNYDGTLMVSASKRLDPYDATEAVFGNVAVVNTVVDDDGVGLATCGNCGKTVGEWFQYCPWCGARFTGTVHSHR